MTVRLARAGAPALLIASLFATPSSAATCSCPESQVLTGSQPGFVNGWNFVVDGDVLATAEQDPNTNNMVVSVWRRDCSGAFVEEQRLDPPGTNSVWDLALDGDTLVVGEASDGTFGLAAGAVRVYRRILGTWTQEPLLFASDATAEDRFGNAVALDGDILVVGAYMDDDVGRDSGSAYVFAWDGATWMQQQKLHASDGVELDAFGGGVDLQGTRIVVGAPTAEDVAFPFFNSGAIYVFEAPSGPPWAEMAIVKPPDADGGELIGGSMELSGDTILTGAPQDDDGGGGDPFFNTGSAYVFTGGGASWSLQAKLHASDMAYNDGFGGRVALEGDVAVVSAIWHDHVLEDSGALYVLRRTGTAWSECQELRLSDEDIHDYFGTDVDLSCGRVFGGAQNDIRIPGHFGTITVFDCPAGPASTVTCLWPPNHHLVRFVNMDALAPPTSSCFASGPVTFTCVSDQCDDAPCAGHPGENGDGNTTNDCTWDPVTRDLLVRSERAATEEEGRTYVVSAQGPACSAIPVLEIRVYHDESDHPGCISPNLTPIVDAGAL